MAFWRIAAENSARPEDTVGAVESLIERDADALILAYDGDLLAGTIIAGWDGWRSHLYRLAVHPDRRRRGIARRLIDAAEQRLRDLGVRRADAMVLDDNRDAHEAWRAAGYTRQDEWSRWVKPLQDPRDHDLTVAK